ncbi:centrosome and spindle pole associated protein 1-like isoform X4 [Lethenteron reissneri]|uniref:centrosome and spindle pole associated protein 1-like isoform X4 n=1 Tax=Lethenteron reissneri TaxID=7753 RepID=UPI002AB62DBD|nr:centrosome and spindle pole associated protein 1-like isoform X4 [Lethenteron reissneri]
MDDDELERFLREQKAKIARDQAQLERDLPYMEMQAQPKQHTHIQDHESESMKENIPQRGSNDKLKYNDDSSTLGLPLGAEYEKKKQKLKEQLRQDYRRYMAEKNFRSKGVVAFETDTTSPSQALEKERPRTHVKETLAELLEERGYADRRHEQQDETSSRKKDAATSMEAYEELLNEHRRGRVVSFEDGLGDPWTARLRHMSARHQSGAEPVGEREEREERTKSAGTRHAPMHAPARAHGILPVHEGRCSVDKRRKERYRLDLLEQMAEREQNKRREKQWNLAVPVSGVVDPQKDPLRMLKMLGSGTTERPRFPMPPQDIPPPDRPRRAFHTPPPLDNENDAAAHRHTNGLQGARTAALPGPGGRFYPASFATPYDPAYYYYAVHNPLEPGLPPFEPGRLGQGQPPLPYYGQVNGPPLAANFTNQWDGGVHPPQAALPPQQNMGLPLTGTWSQAALGQAQYNTVLGPPPEVAQLPRGFPGLTIGLGGLGETNNNTEGRRGSFNKYQEDLQRQIKDTEEKKRRERMERDRQDARLEAEANTYNPWGKGGGGAPLRDDHGNLVTDLKQMRRQNEAAVHNPLKSARRVAPDSRGTPSSFDPQLYNHGDHRPGTPDDAAVHGDGSRQTPRGGTLLDPSLPPQAAEQERYKDFLRQQIEEKRKREAEEREKIREEEEREERRLTEQRERIQREYEEEAEKKRKKEEEQRIKNEELAREAEERKKEVERKRREDEEKRTDEYRRQFERERQARREEVETRGASPPIPALVKKQGFPGTREEQGNGIQVPEARYASPGVSSRRADMSPRSEPPLSRERHPADLHSRATTTANDGVSTGRGSPPVPARRNQLRTEGMGTDVLGELSLFRKQLQNEQRRLESQLRQQESSEEHRDARSRPGAQRSAHSRAASRDVFELARMRVQAPVRRPSSKGVPQHGPHAGHHPPPPTLNYPDDELLDIQRSALVRDQRRRHDAMHRPDPGSFENQVLGMKTRDLGLHLPPEDEGARASRSSMLQSDSAFIGAFGEVFPTDAKGYQAPTAGQDGAWDWEPESRDIGVSPRERRRQRHRAPLEQRQMDMYEPRRPPASPSLLSESSINVERLRARNAERMRRLQQMVTPGDDVSLGDPDDILARFVSPSRPYSAVTTATDVWLRPGSCDSPGAFTERSNGE